MTTPSRPPMRPIEVSILHGLVRSAVDAELIDETGWVP